LKNTLQRQNKQQIRVKLKKSIILCILFFGILLLIPVCATMSNTSPLHTYENNKNLPFIKEGFSGNIINDGVFVDSDHVMDLSFGKILKWKLSSNPDSEEKKKDLFSLNVKKSPEIFSMKEDMIVWLGHASFFIRLDGKTFLIDPVLESITFNKRLSPCPVEISDVKNIDYLLISHAHLDHLDSSSIKKSSLNGTKALIPLRMGKKILDFNPGIEVEEAAWYQKYSTGNGPEVFFLPARHWSRRSLADTNEILWGSYIIKGKSKTIYFAGDSAYGSHFADIAKLFTKIDIALMPIGAYKPDYIMKSNHMSPEESAKASNDLKPKLFIPMHYGTFDLSDEPYGEPLQLIKKLADDKKLVSPLHIVEPGEIIRLF
jgi:L-ascorbate metabolism protein UlaG (beta-lactamase superfamily)